MKMLNSILLVSTCIDVIRMEMSWSISRKRGPNNISPGPPEASSLCAANSEDRYIFVRPIILSKKQRAYQRTNLHEDSSIKDKSERMNKKKKKKKSSL